MEQLTPPPAAARRSTAQRPREHLARLRASAAAGKVLGIVVRGKNDGGGAQVQAKLSGVILARTLGVPFFHVPLGYVAHGDGIADFAQRWNDLTGLGKLAPALPADAVVVALDEFLAEPDHPAAIIEALHFHEFSELDPNQYGILLPDIRQHMRRQLRVPRKPRRVLAVHARRGDVGVDQARHRFTPNAVLLKQISAVRLVRPAIPVELHSEGTTEDFADFVAAGVTLHLNEDPLRTLSQLASAELLITAKSSFSYLAALASRGTVIYQKFWHGPQADWLVVNPKDKPDALAKRIRRALRKRRAASSPAFSLRGALKLLNRWRNKL